MQSRNRLTAVENKLMVSKGGRGGEMNWGIGIDMYRLLHMKQTTNGNLPYRMGSSAQSSVMTQIGSKLKKMGVPVYVSLIHFALQQEINTTL